MRKFTVYMHTTTSVSITVGLTTAELENIAKNLGVSVDKLTTDDLKEFVETKAHNHGIQGLGICCSGYGQPWSREDDGELETDEVVEVDEHEQSVNDYDE